MRTLQRRFQTWRALTPNRSPIVTALSMFAPQNMSPRKIGDICQCLELPYAEHTGTNVSLDSTHVRTWLSHVLLGAISNGRFARTDVPADDLPAIRQALSNGKPRQKLRAMAICLRGCGIIAGPAAQLLKSERRTVARYWTDYQDSGIRSLSKTLRFRAKKADEGAFRDAVFTLLHSPPSAHDINRTTWRMADLHRVLEEQGTPMSRQVIREIIKKAGYKWRHAKTVLTSKDPEYRAKLDHIHSILSGLRPNDRFFSVDEHGPIAIKMKGGRRLVSPDEYPTVPQWQKSKGRLIITAALELSTNQVTHFYSLKKDTEEMIRLMELLLAQYRECDTLYLSWDAASWHESKRLRERVGEVNCEDYRVAHETPAVELVPLPAGAQFLNVIESVFSGLARAVMHNSDYGSVGEAKTAIDRHFRERNEHFRRHPKRAGRKIWGTELVPCEFSETQNCKDPTWR